MMPQMPGLEEITTSMVNDKQHQFLMKEEKLQQLWKGQNTKKDHCNYGIL